MAAKTVKIEEPKRSSALVRQETIASYLFLLPSLIFFLGFVIYPMVLCVVTSFFDSTMNRADVFVGLANYKELFSDPVFIGALKNTFIIVIVSVPVTCAFSLWVSSAIVDLPGGPPASSAACSTCRWSPAPWPLPWCGSGCTTTTTASSTTWAKPSASLIRTSTGWAMKNTPWAASSSSCSPPRWASPSSCTSPPWATLDQSIVEAAEVDGANDFQAFWKIKWPAIMPTTLYILVITTINSFQCFALIQLLTSGGPNHSTDTIMYYIYYTAFKLYRYGYGNAMGVVLAVIIAILSAVQFKLGNQDN